MPENQNVFVKHNHSKCRKFGMTDARAYCAQKGLRLTPVRARALELLLESHKALGAYDILESLRSEGLGSQPPAVYRALDFLVENGFAHRLERLNAFAACAHSQQDHEPMFLICKDCKSVAETPLGNMGQAVEIAAGELGFKVQSQTVEVIGLCPTCLGDA